MRLIDADALIAEYDRVHIGPPGGARKLMENAPTIEPETHEKHTETHPCDLISRETVLRCIKESRENIDWGQSEDGDAFLHYSAALYRTVASSKCVPAVQPEQRWIPCSERPPENPYPCFVTVMDTEPMTGEEFENILPYFVGWDGEQWNDGDGLQCPFEVLAWIPLPEAYRVGERDE